MNFKAQYYKHFYFKKISYWILDYPKFQNAHAIPKSKIYLFVAKLKIFNILSWVLRLLDQPTVFPFRFGFD